MGNEPSRNDRSMSLVCGDDTLKMSQKEIHTGIQQRLRGENRYISKATEPNKEKGFDEDENLPPPEIVNKPVNEEDIEVRAEDKDHLPLPSIAKRLQSNTVPEEVTRIKLKMAGYCSELVHESFKDQDLQKISDGFYNFNDDYFRFNECSFYTGRWFSRKRNGEGTHYWIKDDSYLIYEGFWENDIPNKKGIIKLINFDPTTNDITSYSVYNGEIEYFRKQGNGTLVKIDIKSDIYYEYDGTWQMNKKEGSNCSEKAIDRGSENILYSYKGDFVQGVKDGIGKITFLDGGVYDGTFKDDKMSGKGTYTFPDGKVYKGDFLENRIEGKGELILSQEKKYVGDFKGDLMHGKGKLEWVSIKKKKMRFRYDGDWLMGVQHGNGELLVEFKENKTIIDSDWKYGEIGEIKKPEE